MKKQTQFFFILILIIFFYEIQLRAQNAPSIEWQKCFGGSSNDYARSIQQTIDGGLIIAGYSYSNDGDVSGNHGGADYWIVKTDEVGNTIWQKCFGGTGNDYAYSIQQTTDGGFIATGVSKSNDGDVSGNHGWSDIWTLKLDSSGNITWSTCSGGSYNEAAYSVRETINGDYIIAGHTNSIDGDVVVGDDNWYTNQYWIILLDSSGNLKDQGGGGDYTAHELAYDIQPIGDGGYVFVGQENTGGNYEDYFSINWIDSSLAYAWSGVGFLGEPAGAYAVALTSNNGFVIAGYADTYYYGDANYAILNLDSNQNINWFAELGGSGSDIAWSVQQTSDKGYIAAGYTGSNNGDVSGNHGGNDYWIVYLDSAGNLAWQKALGGSNNDEAFSVQQTVDNGFIIAGNANSYDGNVSGSHGGSDYWIVKLSCYMSQAFYADSDNDGFGNVAASVITSDCSQPAGYIADTTDCDDTNENINPDANEILFNGIDDNCDGFIDEFGTDIYSSPNTVSDFSLFPNPTNGEFVVHLQLNNELNAEAKIEVISLLGQVVCSKASAVLKGKLQDAIKLNDEVDGIYLVRLRVNDEAYYWQIVYQK